MSEIPQRFKVGDFYLELPKGSAISADPAAATVKADKPETPVPLEEAQYVYRPNDPFQASIDEARAIASISSSQKSWVKKTWFALFVVGPLVYAELIAIGLSINGDVSSPGLAFLISNALIMPVWLIYYTIWRRKVKS
ncbi:hypothetical protein ACO0LG_07470 [Undibacterium sp. Ji42W]|uniref:hypothetical protein n=1 Tax=Undibacterium sp. Ji42W TaxID=3413039 RepID=UPI003BEFA393